MSDGFVRLPYELIDSGRLSPVELTVYIALLRYRDHHSGRCWPSYSTIARRARVDRRTAIRVLKRLEEEGIVRVVYAEPKKPKVYEVALFESFPASMSRDSHVTSADSSSDTESPTSDTESPPGDTESPELVTLCHQTSDTESPELEPRTRTTELEPENSTHGRALRSDDTSDTSSSSFGFSTEPEEPASERQVTYLGDLYTHMTGEAAPVALADQWRSMTTGEASERITAWLKSMPRGDTYRGPEYGEDAYNQLSTNGQDAADRAMVPAAPVEQPAEW